MGSSRIMILQAATAAFKEHFKRTTVDTLFDVKTIAKMRVWCSEVWKKSFIGSLRSCIWRMYL
jgi:hypothetical protein